MALPFEDNFDSGPRGEWEQAVGTWRMVNGYWVADETPYWTYAVALVGDLRWSDYAAEVDISHQCIAGYPVRVIVRAQNANSYMAFEADCCNTLILLVANGTAKTIASTSTLALQDPDCPDGWPTDKLRLEVRGNTYTAYSNGAQLLTVQDNTFSTGRAGLGIRRPTYDRPTRFDNFRVLP